MTDVRIAISWLGAAYSVAEFAGIIGMTNQVSRLVTFGISTVKAEAARPPYASYGSYGRSQGYDRDWRGRWY